ncbi:alkaline shock response membrane anchor protein AmaP [Desulfothermobacter acidiphilus]|uniref:alkaline shock response membrane anchor protein AmaP n=1 Tax=Desulfothermobacter acidiphilus TaxID=1938353 RepID=UPI003F8C78C5
MRPLDRGLLFLYSLVGSAAASVLLLALGGWAPALELLRLVGDPVLRWGLIASLAGFLLVGLWLLIVSVSPGGKSVGSLAVIDEGPLGEVKVALTAVESLVVKVVSSFPGVKEVKPKVMASPEGIAVEVRLLATAGISLPSLAQEIQEQVQQTVKEVTGLDLQRVRVVLENVVTAKPRVE